MPTGDAYSFGHLVPSHLGLAYVLLVETNPFPEPVIIFPDYALRTSLGTFSILLQPRNRIQQNLTGSKISTSSTKFFGPIRKSRWPPWPLIGWDIFYFFSAITAENSTFDKKQVLNTLYQLFVFRADRKTKIVALLNIWLAETFSPYSATAGWNSTKLDRKQDTIVPYQVCVFRADLKTTIAVLASDWLRRFYFSWTAERNLI